MPLREFIDETIKILLTDAHEVLTERVASSAIAPGQMTQRLQTGERLVCRWGALAPAPKRKSSPKQGFRIARRKVRCSQLLESLATLAAT
jgi:hypothetical protein